MSLGRIWSFWEREFGRVELSVFLTSSIFGGEKREDLAGVWKAELPFESGVWRVEENFGLVVKKKRQKFWESFERWKERKLEFFVW